MKSIIYIGFVLFCMTSNLVSAQYKMSFKIENLKNETVKLGYYFEDKQYIQDTASTDKNGQVVFEGEEKLPTGLYLLIMPEKKYFDFIISTDQEFVLSTDTLEPIEKMKVTGCQENKLFFEYQKYIIKKNKERKILSEQLEDEKTDSITRRSLEKEIETLNTVMIDYWRQFVDGNPDLFLSTLLTAMNGERPEGYSRQHFFDHIDFSELGLLRTPIIHRAVRMVIARNLNKNLPVEHIIEEVDLMVEKAKLNADVQHYILNHFLNFFSTFPRIGMNRVFVHIADTYYEKSNNDWMEEKSLEQIADRAKKLRSNFVGEIAPELKMEMPSEEYASLHQIEAKYTLLLFWTVGCGHCKDAVKSIQEFLTKVEGHSIEVFAVYTQDKKPEWAAYLEKEQINWTNCWDAENITNYRELYTVYSTPIMYLLDKDKRIVSLLVGLDQIKEVLKTLEEQKEKY